MRSSFKRSRGPQYSTTACPFCKSERANSPRPASDGATKQCSPRPKALAVRTAAVSRASCCSLVRVLTRCGSGGGSSTSCTKPQPLGLHGGCAHQN
eukprot:1434169-Prymnesium_polylepis.4